MVQRFAFLSVGMERCCGRFTPAGARSSLRGMPAATQRLRQSFAAQQLAFADRWLKT